MNPSLELKPFNSFGIDATAKSICIAESAEAIYQQWLEAKKQQLPVLILGGGSNVLFIDNFDGVVILNRIKGINVTETADDWQVYSAAGENWHQFIEYLMNNGINGAENLALIPGCVGSAPIQNIGAYGVELKDICEYVDMLHLITGETVRIQAEECRFGYRDSIFKHEYQDDYIIIGVGFKLSKQWTPKLTYGDLALLDPETVTPQQVFDSVCNTRKMKLPDPAITGNAGSFFKNPIISADKAQQIKQLYPTCPQYLQEDGSVKVAAGWLIDQCGLKGYELGGAAVHTRQALVIINKNQATGNDVVNLARHISQTVHSHFGIMLEPEVRFIGKNGEINPMDCIL
ncbi:UDP-N-acetylmuramate dehydrogenase [Providencia vermicola]|uniref:UDP-N-acetylenolpyruvoylglucosamine reductase n=3 Tax=Providencia TaxID=586 RepID=A0AAI9MYF3_PROST|nr:MULTISPECIES: UDP-N-acetylmuramate dehydrogenase [Providencia]ELR5044119.1 UDP-N-acetylmuramate dehydrogenase [Providencia rettgeri]ELR5037497.1 UDP-N-acetylmuramate dehydrogenase [Providencia stuartii]ELR5123283.1 UDP-N-acetylmuramate dehydrogenase [Providencia stuartii]ELR5144616.1 UDP-N-acetylmuramate dehydrogenase [Providencia stuartii]ELR5293846.1 UDP-N-acetylmuramate dehydrogenase [Providencia stuartii]